MIDIENALQNGEINNYFYNQLNKRLQYLPPDLHETYFDEAKIMSSAGVNSNDEQKIFWYITLHIPEILDEILANKSNWADKIAKISSFIFKNRDNFQINTLLNFYYSVSLAAQKLGFDVKPSIVEQLASRKIAYPQGYTNLSLKRPYDIGRWMQATRDIYSRANIIGDVGQAFNEITGNWNVTEKMDYKAWLKFYQEGTQFKYKAAQNYYNDIGYILSRPAVDVNALKSTLPTPVPTPVLTEVDSEMEDKKEKMKAPYDVNEARTKIEGQRSKIISRLNAAEKLLSSMDGQFFAGDDQEYMLKLLQDLKRKVQTANKLTVNSSLFVDYIYRTANSLKVEGKLKAGRFFYKIAQTAGEEDLLLPSDKGAGPKAKEKAAPQVKEEEGGDVLADPSTAGTMSEAPTLDMGLSELSDSKKQTREAIKEFFKRLENGISDFDEPNSDVGMANDKYAHIIVKAQEALPPQATSPAPLQPLPKEKEEASIEVKEDEVPAFQQKEQQQPPTSQVDDAIETALENVQIKDVIERLEALANIYKKREIARQLAIIDLMMDKLGIGSFFPGLGEAMGKTLEANQYVSTRVEDILSRLRGVYELPESERIMTEVTENVSPENQGLQQSLEAQQQKEQERKERRKEKEDAKMMGTPAPVTQTPEAPPPVPAQELAGPAQVERTNPPVMPPR